MDKSLLKEFYEKHIQRWTKNPFDALNAEQLAAIAQLPDYRIFASKREALIEAVKPSSKP